MVNIRDKFDKYAELNSYLIKNFLIMHFPK